MHENARSSTLYYGKKSSFLGINLRPEKSKKNFSRIFAYLHNNPKDLDFYCTGLLKLFKNIRFTFKNKKICILFPKLF
jgi:hypothetical protein